MGMLLAPLPDFRYVGFLPGQIYGSRVLGGLVAAGAGVGATMWSPFGPKAALAGSLAAMVAGLYSVHRWYLPETSPRTVPMALVPWGLMVEHEDQPRVLRWAAITRVHVEMKYGRDQATDSTLWSLVTVETERERFSGHAPGAVPLDRLMVHLEAYAREASHSVALDLDGARSGEGPEEPDCEPLLGAARAYMESAEASSHLGLEAGSYRRATSRRAGPQALEALGNVLSDRTDRTVDPRPFAAIVAAELGARELANSVVALVQSPHPVVAAVAKVASRRLGVPRARAGTLDEVAPFLQQADVDALEAWAAKST
jgi:hypothetical protein